LYRTELREAMTQAGRQFVFMTCKPGAEAALKLETARAEPDWRLAYSRPGFLTFKLAAHESIDARQLAEHSWTFAHAHGISLGRVTGSQLAQLAAQSWELEGVRALHSTEGFADVHVWEPAASAVVEPGAEPSMAPLCREIEKAVRAAAPESCHGLRRSTTKRRRPTERDRLVLDVAVIAPGEWWIGFHGAVTWPERWPGGAMPVSLPPHAVSRAYAKLEEALTWSGLPIAAGDECVEIGCAPGGASQALLDRGLFVTGIDPADIDAAVRAHPRFRHLRKRGRDVRRHEFSGVQWLVADTNIAPDDTLNEIEPIVTHPGVVIRGMVLTLKLSDWYMAERLPELVRRVRGWGYRDVRARQLTTGGQEVCLVALRRKALRRLGHSRSRRRRSADWARRDTPHTSSSGPHF
jgi:23S rRNA (cytidine2498-2'-O)-methyltransferase